MENKRKERVETTVYFVVRFMSEDGVFYEFVKKPLPPLRFNRKKITLAHSLDTSEKLTNYFLQAVDKYYTGNKDYRSEKLVFKLLKAEKKLLKIAKKVNAKRLDYEAELFGKY
jgi:hypothetical protein